MVFLDGFSFLFDVIGGREFVFFEVVWFFFRRFFVLFGFFVF